MTTKVLRAIQDTIISIKVEMTEQEAILLWTKIKEFRVKTGEEPSLQSFDPKEVRMAEAIIYLREAKRKKQQNA